MKKFLLVSLMIFAFILSGMAQDDVYYSPKKSKIEYKKQDTSIQTDSVYYVEPTETSAGDTYITNNYYDNDDYYDFKYSSRIKRFHSNYYLNSYYSDYYTNLYWYDYDPYDWGISIYFGYNFWDPYYYMPWYSPHYYGWYDWRWNNWNRWYYWNYDPYSYWGYYPHYGWNYWNHGWYGNGYWSGYGGGGYWNKPYYNSYDKNSGFYADHRNSLGGNISRNNNYRTFGDKYNDINKRGTSVYRNDGRRTTSVEPKRNDTRYRYAQSPTRNNSYQKREIQKYTPPTYNQRRDKNEYETPAYRNINREVYKAPEKQRNVVSQPQREQNSERIQRSEQRVPQNVQSQRSEQRVPQNVQPQRSEQRVPQNVQPQRNSNSNTYSSPSRSSNTYSSPSRSSSTPSQGTRHR